MNRYDGIYQVYIPLGKEIDTISGDGDTYLKIEFKKKEPKRITYEHVGVRQAKLGEYYLDDNGDLVLCTQQTTWSVHEIYKQVGVVK